jgi:drug/metabolite transporter (DMT)-like permease
MLQAAAWGRQAAAHSSTWLHRESQAQPLLLPPAQPFHSLCLVFVADGFALLVLVLLLQVEYFAYHKTVSRQKLCAIALLMFGITIATVSDKQVSSNPLGILVAGLAVLSSSLYQV